MDRTQTHHNRVEDMAAFYFQEIQTLQPKGPYYLGGSSFGGLVAFEMARQIEKKGEEVGLLALFDTYGPGYPKPLRSASGFMRGVYRLAEHVQNAKDKLRLLDAKGKAVYLKDRMGKACRMVQRSFAWKKNEIAIKFNQATGRPLPNDLQRNQKAILDALHHYKPGIYGGRMTLFRASRQPKGIQPDRTLGWNGYAVGGIEIHEVPGAHGMQTVDPHARFLVEKLEPCLFAAQSGFNERSANTAHEGSGSQSLVDNQEVTIA
jgi:thioesterase domain-containing protein